MDPKAGPWPAAHPVQRRDRATPDWLVCERERCDWCVTLLAALLRFCNAALPYYAAQVWFAFRPVQQNRKDGTLGYPRSPIIVNRRVLPVNVRWPFAARPRRDKHSSGAWPREVDEFDHAGIARADCQVIAASRVSNAPAALECEMRQIIQLDGEANFIVVGEVVGVHLRDDCMVDGKFDITRFQPLARCGYRDYAVVRDVFSLSRPGE